MIRSLTLFQGLHLLAHAKLNLKFNTTFSRTFQRQSKEVANAWHETTVQFCTCNTLCVESFQCPQEKTPQRGYFSALSFLFRDERKKSLQCALYGARTMREDSVPPNRGFSPLWGREKCQRGFVKGTRTKLFLRYRYFMSKPLTVLLTSPQYLNQPKGKFVFGEE